LSVNPVLIALTDFESIMPSIELKQADSLKYLAKIHAKMSPGEDSEKIAKIVSHFGVKPSQISSRWYESTEIADSDLDIAARTDFFMTRAHEIFGRFYPSESKAPDHIVHVTCTGYAAPSPGQCLIDDRDWSTQTSITHAYHMGCYAAMPSVRMAEGFVAALKQKGREKNPVVDIVHTEMCGLHMSAHDHRPEQIVVQSLFADGHIKYSAVPPSDAKTGFVVLNTCEQIVGDSREDMTWTPGPLGMKMTLSRHVPSKIGSSLRPFLSRLIEGSDHQLHDVLKNAIFAIHPGGPKIIESAQEILELRDDQVAASKHVLFNRGNMSSATLPHVWKHLLDSKMESGRPVVSMAFGPGLTIFGALFKVI
jgi:predicted naringenin-chalcone synthase